MNTVQTLQPHPPVPDFSHPSALRSGVPVRVRPLQPTDREHLAALFTRLSDTSRRDRFLTAMPRQLEAPMLDKLAAAVDGHNHVALVLIATPPGQRPTLIGVGRFARNRPDHTSAEIAVTIDDAYHGLGAGTLLTRELAAAARQNGIASFTATVRTSNTHCLRMLQQVGTVVDWNIEGPAVECRIDLHEMASVLDNPAA